MLYACKKGQKHGKKASFFAFFLTKFTLGAYSQDKRRASTSWYFEATSNTMNPMLFRKAEKDPDDFWREYEEQIGEKVLARSLGQYMSGWEEFDSKKWTELWGLIMATSGGFRFHHFAQTSWLLALSHSSSREPREKTIFIPKEKIISAAFKKETVWWKKLFNNAVQLIIKYRDEAGIEREILLITDPHHGDITEKLEAIK